ncbi:MAG: DNA-directed RNA polymerase subunit omega [Limnochordia bacterium]
MNQPPLEQLLEKTDSRYTLVVTSAKRARQLIQGAEALVQGESSKPVTLALQEIAEDKIRYERTKTGIK